MPFDSRLILDRFLTAADYRFGPAHTELIVTAKGPKIVESQARLGGDRIPAIVEAATGVAMEDEVFRLLKGEAPTSPRPLGVSLVHFFQYEPGKVASVTGVEDAAAMPEVRLIEWKLKPGDVVPATVDSSTRYGCIVVAGESHEDANRALEAALARIDVRMEPH